MLSQVSDLLTCGSQLLSIADYINKSFGCNHPLEVEEIFLDISKAIDRVWYDGLIYKIKSFEISDTLY